MGEERYDDRREQDRGDERPPGVERLRELAALQPGVSIAKGGTDAIPTQAWNCSGFTPGRFISTAASEPAKAEAAMNKSPPDRTTPSGSHITRTTPRNVAAMPIQRFRSGISPRIAMDRRPSSECRAEARWPNSTGRRRPDPREEEREAAATHQETDEGGSPERSRQGNTYGSAITVRSAYRTAA